MKFKEMENLYTNEEEDFNKKQRNLIKDHFVNNTSKSRIKRGKKIIGLTILYILILIIIISFIGYLYN